MTPHDLFGRSRFLAIALGLIAGWASAAVRIESLVPFPNEPDLRAEADGAKLPQLRTRVDPVPPADTAAPRHDVRVHVAFQVDATGKVQAAAVMFAPPAEFAEAAVAAVRQWEFEPGLHYFASAKRLVPVSAQMTVLITFSPEAVQPPQ